MSADEKERAARYEWAEDNALEVVEKGTGKVIDLDELMKPSKSEEK